MPTRLYIWLVHIRNAGDCKFTSHEKIRIAGILICWQSSSTNGLFHVPGILTCSRTSIGPMLKSCWKYGSRILNAREITCVGLSRYATFSYRLCINNSKHWMVRFYVSVFNDIHRLKWNERVLNIDFVQHWGVGRRWQVAKHFTGWLLLALLGSPASNGHESG